MKGIVFTGFLEMVETEFGMGVVDRITQDPALSSHGSYTAVGNYPHDDMLKLVASLSETVGLSPRDLVFAFGKYLMNHFYENYPVFFENTTGSIDFLKGIEEVIHTEVRKLYPDANLPVVDTSFDEVGALHMHYKSDKPFADLAEGLIERSIEIFDDGCTMQRLESKNTDGTSAHFVVAPGHE